MLKFKSRMVLIVTKLVSGYLCNLINCAKKRMGAHGGEKSQAPDSNVPVSDNVLMTCYEKS